MIDESLKLRKWVTILCVGGNNTSDWRDGLKNVHLSIFQTDNEERSSLATYPLQVDLWCLNLQISQFFRKEALRVTAQKKKETTIKAMAIIEKMIDSKVEEKWLLDSVSYIL